MANFTPEQLAKQNRSASFWEAEEPEILRTKKNVFRYYKEANRLTVSLPDWTLNGEVKMGKGVSVNLGELVAVPEVRKRLIAILREAGAKK